MRNDWNSYDLGSVAEFRNGAGIKQDFFSDEGVPLVKVSNFTSDSIDVSDLTKVETSHADRWKSHLLKERDIVIATVGSWPPNWSSVVGKVVRVPAAASGFLQNQNTCCLQPNQEFIDNSFLYYLLKSDDFKHFAVNEAGGSANQARIPVGKLSRFKLLCPPLQQQKAIAHILGTLDDKIELNRQMNVTLEAMAQALFKSWFVDFDPVIDKALAACNEIPEPLQKKAQHRQQVPNDKKLVFANPELAKVFPDRFTFTEVLGWIPEGWEVKRVTELVDTISKTFDLKSRSEIVFLNTGDIENGGFLHNNYVSTVGLPGQAKKSIQKGDILYSEIRPKNKRFAYVDFGASDYVVSTKLMVLRASGYIDSLFTYFVLTQPRVIDALQVEAESRSGTFPQITYDTLNQVQISVPDHEDLVTFFTETILKTNHTKSSALREQNKVIQSLRDTLLPKLISGELRVPEAEQIIADHV